MLRSIIVRAVWDEEARCWVATSEDLPGFVTRAGTIETLQSKALPIIEELIELNNVECISATIPVRVVSDVPTRVVNPRHIG